MSVAYYSRRLTPARLFTHYRSTLTPQKRLEDRGGYLEGS